MEEHRKRGYLLENFRLFHLRTVGGTPVEPHYHEFCKVLLLVSGSGSYTVEGQRYRLESGDVVLVGSRSVHQPELDSAVPYERIIIYISPAFLQHSSTADCQLAELFGSSPVLRPKERQRQKLFALAQQLEQVLGGSGYGQALLCGSALLGLLVELGRVQRREDVQLPSPIRPKNKRVLELMAYLDAHLEDDMDIDTLAGAFYISKYHMMRLFRRETGFTVHTYLLQRRLFHARALMEKGMRATEASYRSGFRSYSSFTRAYSKHFGTTPTGRMDSTRHRTEGYE